MSVVNEFDTINPVFKENCISVVFAADKNYSPCLTVAIASLVANVSENYNYDIVILEDDINFAYKELIKNLKNGYSNIAIRFFNVKKYIKKYEDRFYTNEYFSLAAYFRILIPELFTDYEKVLYLDSDTMIMRDVAELYNIEIENNLICATKDLGTQLLYRGKQDINTYFNKNLKYNDISSYFQNGVMLMNLKKMRDEEFFEKFLETIKNVLPPLYFVDQDVFNVICKNQVKYLDQTWDVVTNTDWIADNFPSAISEYVKRDYKNNLKRARIFHYVSKNWQYNSIPAYDVFWNYVNVLPKFVKYDLRKLILSDSKEKNLKKIFSLNMKANGAYLLEDKHMKCCDENNYYYNNRYEVRDFLKDFYAYFEREDFQERYESLVKGLDEDSIKTINNSIQQIKETKQMLDNFNEIDLYSPEEKENFKILDRDFHKKIYKITDKLYRYQDYCLPINDFGPSVFYYKYGLEHVKSLDMLKNKSIMDVGACIGDSAMIFSELDCDKIYAFEPNKKNFDLLNSTIKMNMLNKVVAVKLALGAETKVLSMKLCGSGSTFVLSNDAVDNSETQDTYVVKLDDYVKKHNIEVGLIKTDLEGFEQEFLKGAEQTIKAQRPILIISLYHRASDYFEIKPIIESWNLGYKFKIIKPLIYNVVNAETILIAEVEEE